MSNDLKRRFTTQPFALRRPCDGFLVCARILEKKCLAGGLDGTASPVVTSTPIHLTCAIEDTL